jgi:hypothetical protein
MIVRPASTHADRLLGTTGLFFMLLIARLTPVALDARGAPRTGVPAAMARLGLGAIGLLGSTVDWLATGLTTAADPGQPALHGRR